MKATHNSLNIAYEVLESHTNTVKASVQDLDQKNKDLQDSNTSLSKENTKLFASIYNLNRNRSSLRSLFARSDRHASDLEAKLAYVQEISAANAQKATLSATALQNAGSKTTTLKEQIDYYKDLISSNDSLQRLAIDETQDQLFRLSALEEDRLQLEWQNTDVLNASSVHGFDVANKDEEIFCCAQRLSFRSRLSRVLPRPRIFRKRSPSVSSKTQRKGRAISRR